jgi:hypothetical protein
MLNARWILSERYLIAGLIKTIGHLILDVV